MKIKLCIHYNFYPLHQIFRQNSNFQFLHKTTIMLLEIQSTNSQQEIQTLYQNFSQTIKDFNDKKERKRWTDQQNKRYCLFILDNKLTLEKLDKQSKDGIYNSMSRFVKTRNSAQCKSHHQKMIQRQKTIQKVVNKLMTKINKQNGSQKDESILSSKDLPPLIDEEQISLRREVIEERELEMRERIWDDEDRIFFEDDIFGDSIIV